MKKLARQKLHAMMELSNQLLEDAVEEVEVVAVVDEDVVDEDVVDVDVEVEEEDNNSIMKIKQIFLIIGVYILR